MTIDEAKKYIIGNNEVLESFGEMFLNLFLNNQELINFKYLDTNPEDVYFSFDLMSKKIKDTKLFKGSLLNQRLTNNINKPKFNDDKFYSFREVCNNYVNLEIKEDDLKKYNTLLKKGVLYAGE